MHRYQAFWGVAAILCGALTIGPAAVAQTFDVKQLDIKQGSLEIGLDNSFFGGVPRNNNLNRSAHDQSIDYGVREWWRLSAVLKLENPDHGDLHAEHECLECRAAAQIIGTVKLADLGCDVALEETDTDEETRDRGDKQDIERHQEVAGDHEQRAERHSHGAAEPSVGDEAADQRREVCAADGTAGSPRRARCSPAAASTA